MISTKIQKIIFYIKIILIFYKFKCKKKRNNNKIEKLIINYKKRENKNNKIK